LAYVLGRDPGLREPAVGEQLAQPARVLAIGLGTTLATAQRTRLDRLAQMRPRPGGDQRVTDEQPPGAGLHRDVRLAATETLNPPRHGRRRRVDPAASHLAR